MEVDRFSPVDLQIDERRDSHIERGKRVHTRTRPWLDKLKEDARFQRNEGLSANEMSDFRLILVGLDLRQQDFSFVVARAKRAF
jgi:hypothetical protein